MFTHLGLIQADSLEWATKKLFKCLCSFQNLEIFNKFLRAAIPVLSIKKEIYMFGVFGELAMLLFLEY